MPDSPNDSEHVAILVRYALPRRYLAAKRLPHQPMERSRTRSRYLHDTVAIVVQTACQNCCCPRGRHGHEGRPRRHHRSSSRDSSLPRREGVLGRTTPAVIYAVFRCLAECTAFETKCTGKGCWLLPAGHCFLFLVSMRSGSDSSSSSVVSSISTSKYQGLMVLSPEVQIVVVVLCLPHT